jgi:hypothetical protein
MRRLAPTLVLREARELLALEDKTIAGEVVQKGKESAFIVGPKRA